jgi:integrase-like protein
MLQQVPHALVSPHASSLTVADYLEQWLSYSKGRVRGRTHEGYRGLIHLYALPALGSVPLRDLAPLDLQRLYGQCLQRGLAGGTVLNLHLVLTQALSRPVRWGWSSPTPQAGLSSPAPPSRTVRGGTGLAERIRRELGHAREGPRGHHQRHRDAPGGILALHRADLDPDY